jgi:hypothetical protein
MSKVTPLRLGATDMQSLLYKEVPCPSDFNTVMGSLQK